MLPTQIGSTKAPPVEVRMPCAHFHSSTAMIAPDAQVTARLQSVGRHDLRGVASAQELFTPTEELVSLYS